jgi:hypothetical protein
MNTATTTLKNMRRPASEIVDEAQTFKIETGIPIPKRGQPPSQTTKAALEKLVFALNNMRPNQSIVIAHLSASTVRKYLRKMFPELKTRLQVANRERKWYRLWILE